MVPFQYIPLMCSFLILSILVALRENLGILMSATSGCRSDVVVLYLQMKEILKQIEHYTEIGRRDGKMLSTNMLGNKLKTKICSSRSTYFGTKFVK